MVLRKIFALKEEKTGDWRKFHNKELRDVDFSADFIWLIKRRRMRWVRHVARVREKRNVYIVWVTKTEDKTLL
jgi:hypothetical protein